METEVVMQLQIDLRSNYERKTDCLGPLIKHAEIVRRNQKAPSIQVMPIN